MDPLDIVFDYHERTKHHPQRYARSLGYLDWATQPDPFRRFAGAELIALPPLTEDDSPPYGAIYQRGQVAPAPLSARSLSRLLECSLALSAWKEYRGTRWALRANPSSGNLHPTEGYLILGPLDGIGSTAGVFHYAAKEHALERRAALDTETWRALVSRLPPGSFFVGLTSVLWRETWKYGERAFRYCQHDVGHALAAVRFAAAMLGWSMVMLETMSDDDLSRLLGLDRREDFEGAEVEHPDLVAVILPNHTHAGDSRSVARFTLPFSRESIDGVTGACWTGKANALSRDHVDWDIIDLVADATRFLGQPDTDPTQTVTAAVTSVPHPRGVGHPAHPAIATAHQIIRRRRSAVAFDGETTISADTFYHVLSRVMPLETGNPPEELADPPVAGSKSQIGRGGLETIPTRAIPFDAFSWSPRIHLLMFVHRVVSLPPGLYVLVRDADQLQRLKSSMSPEFTWVKPEVCPTALPLYLLQEADCRKAAAQLSLMQDIAGDGVFSLGMLADFERSLLEFGPFFYRRLFWEAGAVGQVLYLEAEAAGIRATGIGAYFDDWVHDVFGIEDRAFQSLYHFTMGGPVEDTRLTTLPAYPWSSD